AVAASFCWGRLKQLCNREFYKKLKAFLKTNSKATIAAGIVFMVGTVATWVPVFFCSQLPVVVTCILSFGVPVITLLTFLVAKAVCYPCSSPLSQQEVTLPTFTLEEKSEDEHYTTVQIIKYLKTLNP
ncbi:hypothetical protein, partial [Streptococcus pneumoniae]|uniref:hypothetical protein n=1 Tax=Streptococcus pneumoniae TaxID=1313 RepID=UPI00344C0205